MNPEPPSLFGRVTGALGSAASSVTGAVSGAAGSVKRGVGSIFSGWGSSSTPAPATGSAAVEGQTAVQGGRRRRYRDRKTKKITRRRKTKKHSRR
jgi:hypothetical protein